METDFFLHEQEQEALTFKDRLLEFQLCPLFLSDGTLYLAVFSSIVGIPGILGALPGMIY